MDLCNIQKLRLNYILQNIVCSIFFFVDFFYFFFSKPDIFFIHTHSFLKERKIKHLSDLYKNGQSCSHTRKRVGTSGPESIPVLILSRIAEFLPCGMAILALLFTFQAVLVAVAGLGPSSKTVSTTSQRRLPLVQKVECECGSQASRVRLHFWLIGWLVCWSSGLFSAFFLFI